jgi:hypothetical protein
MLLLGLVCCLPLAQDPGQPELARHLPAAPSPAKLPALPVDKYEPEPAPAAGLVPPRPPGRADRGAAGAAADAIRAMLADPGLLLFDQPTPGGAWWARGSNFKASFAEDGWTLYGKPLPGAPELEPIAVRLAGVRVGAEPLPIVDGKPRRDGSRIEFDHGSTVQRLDVDSGGLDLSFVFASLPARGELVVDLAVRTALEDVVERDRDRRGRPPRRMCDRAGRWARPDPCARTIRRRCDDAARDRSTHRLRRSGDEHGR